MKNVKIYCWTYCPYCIRAKALLDAKRIPYEEIVIDGDQKALNNLKSQTGSGTVPQIFLEDTFIGGCDELHQLDAEGKFDALFR